jgi:hypothetical protein
MASKVLRVAELTTNINVPSVKSHFLPNLTLRS